MRLLLVALCVAGCTTVPAGFTPDAGEPHGPLLFADPSPGPALRWANLRPEGELLAVDLVLDAAVPEVYGAALRLKVDGARFVRAEPTAEWPIARHAALETGASLVLSSLGAGEGRALEAGTVLTVWLDAKGSTSGTLALDAKHSGLVMASGARAELGWGTARFEIH